ncbi:retrovirus-related pol polyprotein from transposon TNT 1-94 [Tanacetum coccineum]
MSNTNTNLQTQTSNALHNAIMEVGGKDCPPMLVPGNYIQWKSKIKRYIDTKPNNEHIYYCLQNPSYKFKWTEKTVPVAEGSSETTKEGYMENYKNVSQDIRNQLNAEAEVVQIILTGIDNDIYSTVDSCPNACEMWKAIERFYKMMNELIRNQCDVTNHQVNVQFLLQLQPEWQRFVILVKQSQELKSVSYHKLYDILKQHQNEVNEIRAKRLARTANPLALVAQKQPIYHPQNHPNHYTQNSSTRSQPAATRNRGKAIVNSPPPTYDQEPTMVAEDDEISKEKEINKILALISLSFKKIYKPTNDNLRTSSNTSRANQDNTPRINRGIGYDNQRAVNVAGVRENVGIQVVKQSGIQCYNCKEYGHVARECQKPKWAKDAAYHKEKMLLCKQEETGIQLSAEQADWRDDTDDKPDDQELETHYLYMAKIQEVTPDAADNSGPIFDTEPLQKIQNDNDNYNVFANDREHLEQPESVNDTYMDEQGDTNITIDSLDMSTNGETVDQDDDDLAKERDLLAYLIEKLKCEIDDSQNRNKFLESSNKSLIDKLKGEIEDFKTKNKSLESSNNHFKEANNELSKTNQLMFKFLKKFQAKLDRYHDVNYASKVKIDCAKDKGVIPTTSVSRPQLKSNRLEDRVMHNISEGKKQQVEDHLEMILFIVDYGCSKHMTGNLKLLSNFVEQFLSTVKFGNDQIAPILGYGDLVQGNVTIKRVYYVEGLNYNLFSIGQFCDADLEVAFQKSTCYIRDLKGNDLLIGSCGIELYSITIQDTSTPNLIFLMAKATSSQAWLCHRRLSLLNFNTINLLSKNDIVIDLPKLKFIKDHLCSSCELGKAKRKSFKTKTTPSLKRHLQILHLDLCGPMRVESFNVRTVQIDKGMEFLNKTLHTYFAQEGIVHQTSTARTPEQSAAKVLLFFWAEAIATTCFTQNCSLVIPRHEKTPYHIINGRKPSVKFFHDLDLFATLVYNKRTRVIVETIHVNFDELPQMASNHVSSDPVPQCLTMALEHASLSPGPQSQENVPHSSEIVTMSNEMDFLFSLMFDELLNGTTPVVSKSSAVTATDAPNQRQ